MISIKKLTLTFEFILLHLLRILTVLYEVREKERIPKENNYLF